LVFLVGGADFAHQLPFFQDGPDDELRTDDHIGQDGREAQIPGPNDQKSSQVPGMADHPVDTRDHESAISGQRTVNPSFFDLGDLQKLK
jgi:hypothetical protein